MSGRKGYLAGTVILAAICLAGALEAEDKEAEGIKVGDSFVDFKLPCVDGKLVSTSGLREGKVLILEFTTCWCKNSAGQLKEMQILAAEVDADKVQLIEVNVLSPIEYIRIELEQQKRKHDYPVLVDNDLNSEKRIAGKFFVDRSPTIFVVDPAGEIRFIGHMVPWKKLKKMTDEVLEEEKQKNEMKEKE